MPASPAGPERVPPVSRESRGAGGQADGVSEFTTPEDAEATTTLLRAPAAIAASFFLVGAVAAQVVWSSGTVDAVVASMLRSLAVVFVCVPFLLSTRRYRPSPRRRATGRLRQTVMRGWIAAAAVAVTIRSIYLCVSLFPLPFGDWLTAAALQVAIVGVFWLAVFALVWRPSPAGVDVD